MQEVDPSNPALMYMIFFSSVSRSLNRVQRLRARSHTLPFVVSFTPAQSDTNLSENIQKFVWRAGKWVVLGFCGAMT